MDSERRKEVSGFIDLIEKALDGADTKAHLAIDYYKLPVQVDDEGDTGALAIATVKALQEQLDLNEDFGGGS